PSLKGGGARRSLGHLPLQVVLRSSQVLKPSPPMPLAGRQLPCLRLPPPQPGLAPPSSRDRYPYRLNEHAPVLPPPCLRSNLRSYMAHSPPPIPLHPLSLPPKPLSLPHGQPLSNSLLSPQRLLLFLPHHGQQWRGRAGRRPQHHRSPARRRPPPLPQLKPLPLGRALR